MHLATKTLCLTMLLAFASAHSMAQEVYGVMQHNPDKSNSERFEALVSCRELAKSGGKVPSAPTETSTPESGSSTGTLVAGALGGAIGAGLFQNISTIIKLWPKSDDTDLDTKRLIYANCLAEKGYVVFPPANLDRFPKDIVLPPDYVREKPTTIMLYEGWELYATIPNSSNSIMVQAIDKKLIPNLQAYVKLYAQKQTTKAERFEVGQVKPYSFGSYKGYTFETKSIVTAPHNHTTYLYLDVGNYVLAIAAVSHMETYEQNKAIEKDLPKYFIPTLTSVQPKANE